MTEIVSLTPTATRVLEELAIYRFLSPKQMVRLGVCRDRQHLYKTLEGLQSVRRKDGRRKERQPREIGMLDFGTLPNVGRLPCLYYLTKRGATLLEEVRPELSPVHYPVKVTKFARDYFHRVQFVDCHIALRRWAKREGHTLTWFRSYFDYVRGTGEGTFQATSVRKDGFRIVPDGIFMLRGPGGEQRLFAFELARGRETKHVEDQIQRYGRALDAELIEQSVDADGAGGLLRVLFVFEDMRGLELARDRLQQHPEFSDDELGPQVFLKPLTAFENPEPDVRSGWFGIRGMDLRSLF